jgi:general L-amino acid transport system permease protein
MSASQPKGPRKPPPRSATAWARENLFASPANGLMTLVLLAITLWLAWTAFSWGVLHADFTAASRAECPDDGACWGIVTSRWPRVLAGFYPEGHLWRVAVAFVCLGVACAPIAVRRAPPWSFLFAPLGVIAAFSVLGGANVLPRVPNEYWGGFLLNVLLGVVGAIFALPIGVLLAFGRRSSLPVVKVLSVGFIEFVRGAPLITLLFMASVVLPLFMPTGVSLDRLTRALVVITLFESAYMAEVIRGGLQAVPAGQREAARALGLGPLRTAALVVTPQALRISIPAIVNTFIGLFKDTTLVYVIALMEVTGMMRQALADTAWQGREVEAYAFIALVFWIACFAMSRFAAALERPQQGRLSQEPA